MEHSSTSRLDLFIGPMFSSKTTALLRKLAQLGEMGLRVLYINHAIDTRADTNYSTHSSLLKEGGNSIPSIKTSELSNELLEKISEYAVIGIDEAQFFSDLVPFVSKLVDTHGKYVMVSGLDGNYKRERIGSILDLIPLADNVVKLHAYCKKCFRSSGILREANFTLYLKDSSETIIIGGAEQYEPACRLCYLHVKN